MADKQRSWYQKVQGLLDTIYSEDESTLKIPQDLDLASVDVTDLDVGGGYSSGGSGSTLSTTGNLQLNGALTVDGASTLTGGVTGGLGVTGTLGVTGNETVSGQIQIGVQVSPAILLGGGKSDAYLNTATGTKEFIKFYLSTSATSGSVQGLYMRLKNTGINGTTDGHALLAGRFYSQTSAAMADMYGLHATAEVLAGGNITGLATGVRGCVTLNGTAMAGAGSCFGVMAETISNQTVANPARYSPFLVRTSGSGIKPIYLMSIGDADGPIPTGAGSMFHTVTTPTIDHYLRVLINDAPYGIPVFANPT